MHSEHKIGQVVGCRNCGASLPFTGDPVVVCPNCHASSAIADPLLSKVSDYHSHAKRQLEHAQADVDQVAEQEAIHNPKNQWAQLLLCLLFIAVIAPIGLAADYLQHTSLPRWVIDWGFVAVVWVLYAVVVISGMTIFYSRKRLRLRRPAPIAARCPRCGAALPMVAGAISQSCPFCRADVIPSDPIIREAKGAINAAARQARLAKYRAERVSWVKIDINSRFGELGPAIIIGAMVVAMIVLSLIAIANGEVPHIYLWPVVCASSLGLAGAAGWLTYRKGLADQWTALARQLAAKWGGSASRRDTWAMVDWLNAHWASKYPIGAISLGRLSHTISFQLSGYPVLLVLDPYEREQRPAKVHVLLAVEEMPSAPSGAAHPLSTARGQILVQALKRSGFSLQWKTSGFLATMDDEPLRRLRKDPNEVWTVAHVVATLVSAAAELGLRDEGPSQEREGCPPSPATRAKADERG